MPTTVSFFIRFQSEFLRDLPFQVEYIAEGCTATYNMYPAPYATTTADHSLSYMTHSAPNFNHTLYPTATALDNRYLTTTDNIFHQYR